MSEKVMRRRIRSRLMSMTPNEYQKKVYLKDLPTEKTLRGPWFEDEEGTYTIVEDLLND